MAVFISFSFSHIIQTLSFFGAVCWRVRRRQKIASLLCRSEGFCCDKSDRVTEQLSGLLTDYLSIIWLGDGLMCGQLNDWLVFTVPDRLIDCLLCWLDVNLTDFLSTCLWVSDVLSCRKSDWWPSYNLIGRLCQPTTVTGDGNGLCFSLLTSNLFISGWSDQTLID